MKLLLVAVSLLLPFTSSLAITKADKRAMHRGDLGRAAWIQNRGKPGHSYQRCMELGLARGVVPNIRAHWCTLHGFNQ